MCDHRPNSPRMDKFICLKVYTYLFFHTKLWFIELGGGKKALGEFHEFSIVKMKLDVHEVINESLARTSQHY